MLVLDRDLKESINIGDDIEVKVLGIGQGRVSIGIAAPINIPVHRNEIYRKIKEKELKNGDGR